MSKEYDDTNTGIIGTNDYKQKDTHPDQRGRVNVNGLWYWVSGWDKVGSNGRKFTSLSFTLMTQGEVDTMMEKRKAKQAPQQGAQQQQQQTQQQAAPKSEPQAQQSIPEGHPAGEPPMDFDDDILF